MTIEFIMQEAENLVHDMINREARAQGHYLTGRMGRSLTASVSKTRVSCSLNGFAVDYMKIVNEGVEPDKISGKMIPGLTAYFIQRGLPADQAKLAAGRTFAKWKKEGMSTKASARFSSTGGRHHFIEAAFLHPDIDNHVLSMIERGIHEQYLKTKSETV